MKIFQPALLLFVGVTFLHAVSPPIPNNQIDYDAFLVNAGAVNELRKTKRVTEEEFIRMAKDPSVVVYDARSGFMYERLHIQGAKHLSLPDVTEAELKKILPDKKTRVLICCNNNFINEPGAFPTKAKSASLNIYTFNTLYSYGYENVFELGPVVDILDTKLKFEGTSVGKKVMFRVTRR